MSRKAQEKGRGRALDLWQAPDGSGDALICLATTFTFDAAFFETDCLGRFLSMDTHPSESESVGYVVEREEKLAAARTFVFVDRSHATEKESFRWDVIGVRVPDGIQHAKVALLVWSNHARIIIGSGNLTETAYRKNYELFGTIDYSRANGGDMAALSATCDFLERVAASAVGSREAGAPLSRTAETIRDARSYVGAWPNRLRKRGDAVPVFGWPGEAVLTQFRALWPAANQPPRDAWVVSPFFDQAPDEKRTMRALISGLAQRGARYVGLCVQTEARPDGTRVVRAPRGLVEEAAAKCEVELYSVVPTEDDALRPLHAKLLEIESDEWRLLMIGSSNFTSAGLLATIGRGNLEANLAYVYRNGDEDYAACETLWPDYDQDVDLDVADSTLLWDAPADSDDEPAGIPPLPPFFADAIYRPGESPAIEFQLDGRGPKWWTIGVNNGPVLLASSEAIAAGRHVLDWRDREVPFVLKVEWEAADGQRHPAAWPVNASDPALLPPPAALRDLQLHELLEVLGSTRPLHEAVLRVLMKRAERAFGKDVELDPLKRHDSPTFLLRRTRRVARVLEALRARIERPCSSRDAFAWRINGPVGPLVLGRALLTDSPSSGEARFCLAELALALGRVDRESVAKGGIAAKHVNQMLADCIEALSALAREASSDQTGPVDEYAAAAFARAATA